MSEQLQFHQNENPQNTHMIDRVPSDEELRYIFPNAESSIPEFYYPENESLSVESEQGVASPEANQGRRSLAYRVGRFVGRVVARRNINRDSEEKIHKFTLSDIYEDMAQLRNELGLLRMDSRYGISEEIRETHLDKIGEMIEAGYPEGSIELMKFGMLNGKSLENVDEFVRNGQGVLNVRRTFAEMYAQHPDTAEKLIDLKIVGLHGTRSSALPDILQQGSLLSAREARARGIKHTTGEHIFQEAAGQESISFSTMEEMQRAMSHAGNELAVRERTHEEVLKNLSDAILYYGEVLNKENRSSSYKEVLQTRRQELQDVLESVRENPDSLQAEMLRDSFPVLFAVSAESVFKGSDKKIEDNTHWAPKKRTLNEYNEFRAAREEIGLDELVIAVPEARIEKVKALYERFGIKPLEIIPIEHITSEYFVWLQEQLASQPTNNT